MSVFAQFALICSVCLAGEGLAALLPVKFPGSVIGLLLLALLLFTGMVKVDRLSCVSEFFLVNMAFFFLPSCVSVVDQFHLLRGVLVPFLAVCVLTTPIVFLAAAWAVRAVTALLRGRGEGAEEDA